MSETRSVRAVLSAEDKNFTSTFGKAEGVAASLSSRLGSGLGFGVMQAVGMKAVNAVSGALGGLVGSVVDVGKSFDASMSQVAATMGVSKDSIQELSDFARQMGATTQFSATQAADALNYMALAGYDSATSMQVLPDVLNLAAAGSMDLARASDMVTDTQTAFGISLERTSQMVDEMAKAASTGNTSVEQLGDAFLTVGGLAQELNGGFVTLADGTKAPVDGVQELEIALTAMANAGIKGSEAGTHMRNMLLKLSDPAAEGTKQLESMGVSVFDLNGNMRSLNDIFGDLNGAMSGMAQEDKIQAIADLFNARDIASAEAILNAVEEDWDHIGEAILGAKGAADQMAKTQNDNLAGDVKLLNSALDELRISIFDNFNDPMRAAVEVATAGITSVSEAVKGFGDLLGGAFDFEEFKAALDENGISGALRVVLGDLGKLPEGFKEAGAAGGAALAGIMASRFFDSGAWKTVRQGMTAVGRTPEMIGGAFEKLNAVIGKSKIGGKLTEIGKNFSSMVKTDIIDGLTEKFPKLTSVVGTAGSAISKTSGVVVSSMQKMMGMALQAIMPAAMIGVVLAGLGLIYSAFGDQIDAILQMAQQKGPEIISGLADGIASRVPDLISQGAQLVTGLLNTLTANIPAIVAGGAQIIMSLVQGVSNALPALLPAAALTVMTLVGSIVEQIPGMISTGLQLLLGLAQGIANSLPIIIGMGVQTIGNFIQGLSENLPQILQTAAAIVTTLINGIVQNLPALIQGAISCIGALASGFISNLPVIIETGIQIILALAEGIVTAFFEFIGSIPDLFGQLVEAIMSVNWLDVGSQILEAIGGGLMSGVSWLGDKFSGLFSGNEATQSAQSGGTESGNAYTQSAVASVSAGTAQVAAAAGAGGTQSGQAFLTGLNESFGQQDFSSYGITLSTGLNAGLEEGLSVIPTTVDGYMNQIPSIVDTYTQDAVSNMESGTQAAQTAVQGSCDSVVSALTSSGEQSVGIAESTASGIIEALNGVVGDAYDAGQNIGEGLANGLESMQGRVEAAAESIASAAEAAIRAAAQVHSPSKVTTRIGEYWGEGFVNGIASMMKEAWNTSQQMVAIPKIPAFRAHDVGFDGEVYGGNAEYTVIVPVMLDGKQIAEVTAPITEEFLNRRNRNSSRKAGMA